MSEIKQNQVVSILYEVKDSDTKDYIDGNMEGKPLDFLVGAGQVIQGLEKAILKAQKGDKFNITIPPEDAYGIYDSNSLQEVSKDQFEGISLERGMTLFGQAQDGQMVQVVVKDFNDSNVIIDYNHPLAGKTLIFDIEIVDVRDASPEEILNKAAVSGCGCGGHEHKEGECCGGGGNHSCGCHH